MCTGLIKTKLCLDFSLILPSRSTIRSQMVIQVKGLSIIIFHCQSYRVNADTIWGLRGFFEYICQDFVSQGFSEPALRNRGDLYLSHNTKMCWKINEAWLTKRERLTKCERFRKMVEKLSFHQLLLSENLH